MALKCSMNGSPKKKNNKNKKKSKKIIKIKNYERVVANTRLRRVNCSDVLGFELFLGFCNFPEFGAPIVTWFIQGWLWCEKKVFEKITRISSMANVSENLCFSQFYFFVFTFSVNFQSSQDNLIYTIKKGSSNSMEIEEKVKNDFLAL